MKTCFKCGEEKDLSEFYRHKKMADGHLNKCKDCTKKDVKDRYESKVEDPEWVEKERARGRDKYHRLGYISHRSRSKKKAYVAWCKKFPEKMEAYRLCQNEPCPTGHQRHHWSYRTEHAKDVILLTQKDHYTLHRFIRYDPDSFMYKTLEGDLLDTKEKHLAYYESLIPF